MIGRLLKNLREIVLAAFLIITCAVMATLSPYFLTVSNLMDVARHLAEVGIIACGMTFIIMTGGIDLSVGSLLGLCGIVLGYSWPRLGGGGAIAAALLAGLAGGVLNGFFVTACALPPLIVTLATMALFRGLAMQISHAKPVSDFPTWFAWFGQGEFARTPTQLLIWAVVFALAIILVARTVAGRYASALGNNERAARVAALPVAWTKFTIYALTGLLCAVSAVIFTSRVATAKADAGEGLELDVITAVVLGGTAITGGRGTILGTLMGVLILGILRNGLSLAGISSVWQTIFAGSVLILTALLNRRLMHRSK